MAGVPVPEDRGPHRPRFQTSMGDVSASDYARRMQDSPANNHEQGVRRAQSVGDNAPDKRDAHVWVHGEEGPKYLGSFDRVIPHEHDGQRGVLLQPHGSGHAKFMPDSAIHTIEHRPTLREQP